MNQLALPVARSSLRRGWCGLLRPPGEHSTDRDAAADELVASRVAQTPCKSRKAARELKPVAADDDAFQLTLTAQGSIFTVRSRALATVPGFYVPSNVNTT
jgi:hypothetical protein